MAAPTFATIPGEPFFPLGYDSGLDSLEELFGDQSLPPLDFDDAMAVLQFDDSDMRWISPQYLDNSGVHSEVTKSPSIGSHRLPTEGSLSLSPSAASQQILTPGSTQLESPYVTSLEDPESDTNVSTSPESDQSPGRDYVVVSQRNRGTRGANRTMNNRPSNSSSTQAHQPASITSRDNSGEHSFTSSSSGAMGTYALATGQYSSFQTGDFTLFDNTGAGFENSFSAPHVANTSSLPFRSSHNATIPSQSPFQAQYPQSADFSIPNTSTLYSSQGFNQNFNITNNSFTSPAAQQYTSDADFQHFLNEARMGHSSSQPQSSTFTHAHPSSRTTFTSAPSVSTGATITQAIPIPRQTQQYPRLQVNITSADGDISPQSSRSATSFDGLNTSLGGMFPAIRRADPSMRHTTGPQRVAQQEHKVSKGGRKKGVHLPDQSRARSHQMRKLGACWRCAMQRDPCDHGDPCSRCAMREQRGQTYYFGCDRSKLPDFVTEFLPSSLCLDHTKQVLENVVANEVVRWHPETAIDVYLSCGYGPPLRWRLIEFTPKSEKLLYQLQFFQDPITNRSMHRKKYAPPYGLLKLDSVDDAHFDEYLKALLEPFHLRELAQCCYMEENEVDPDMFQCHVLDLMAKLYMGTQDEKLKALLQDILRMMVITWIMCHTLTITEETLPPVINNIRHTNKPRDDQLQEFTSPRLANRQLKFFFNVMRNQIYEKLLKWLQQTLHTAGKKEQTWLQSFCVILGFAMVLEEIQRTMQCGAEASIVRNEATVEEATAQAATGCQGIDDRFKLLIGLFQCKYRDKKWGEHGSFGNATPELKEPIAREFCANLRGLVEWREPHLRLRESVTFSLENQCLYTTRLTARFLLPFLNLANTS